MITIAVYSYGIPATESFLLQGDLHGSSYNKLTIRLLMLPLNNSAVLYNSSYITNKCINASAYVIIKAFIGCPTQFNTDVTVQWLNKLVWHGHILVMFCQYPLKAVNLLLNLLIIQQVLKYLVGTTGFEPATPCTPCRCATKLRYVPTRKKVLGHYVQLVNGYFILSPLLLSFHSNASQTARTAWPFPYSVATIAGIMLPSRRKTRHYSVPAKKRKE